MSHGRGVHAIGLACLVLALHRTLVTCDSDTNFRVWRDQAASVAGVSPTVAASASLVHCGVQCTDAGNCVAANYERESGVCAMWPQGTLSVSPSPGISTIRTIREIRLVGGPTEQSGRLEILNEGEWGTVCDDGFDVTDATVVCKSLGYTSGISHASAYYGQGVGRIWLDDVVCTGSESLLEDCGFPGWGVSNCNHGEDVSVTCT